MRAGFPAIAAAMLAAAIAAPASAQDLYGTLKKIKESGSIGIGHNSDSPPFSYVGKDGKPEGYTVDLCLKIAEGVKQELKMDKLEIKYTQLIATTRIPLLLNGTIDLVCGTTTNNLTRQKQVDFLSTIFITGNRILTRKDSGIKELEDLKGKRVTVNQGTSNEKIIKDLDAKHRLGIRFLDTKDQPQGWIALETGRSDAHVTDEVVALGLIAKSKEPDKYATVGRLLSFDPYSIVVRRDDSAFRLVGNRVLADLFRSGEIEAIYKKWMSTINMPLTEQMKVVFQSQAFPE
ncbi:MAG: amino acid ABC transporter substrate-binding protein [Alphaproteobacteria bacterium]|nr:amino acid ABC transporter substrate-binding protein [Alphaproteobacteria bacterium]